MLACNRDLVTLTRQVARRALFLIDKQGMVRGKWQGETEEMLPADEVMQVAQEIAGAW